ncbi:hypothetical protein ACXYTP_07305 [Tsukamurella ocularis]|uniref:hypothetical protein n=1 Tax=Tsukamurella TaxID=2060 RepID=UPI002DD422EA|nr:hypothetical protein [Tsukamurella tyrosinosolvens]MEC4615830.1 hypothetical protein [Tsukamurella tyrosinosolvens]
MITALRSHMPIDIDIKYQLDPSDLEGGSDLARQLAGRDLFTLPSRDGAKFRPETASVRFWDQAGGSWTVVLTGPMVKKDGKLGSATRQCAFAHTDTAPPPAWVAELVNDARERAARAIKAEL